MKHIEVFSTNLLSNFDKELIKQCDDAGYTAVVISCYDPSVPASKIWADSRIQFIVAHPNCKADDGYPAIWTIIRRIHPASASGCGNSHQYQLTKNHVYTKSTCFQKIDGVWYVTKLADHIADLSKKFGI